MEDFSAQDDLQATLLHGLLLLLKKDGHAFEPVAVEPFLVTGLGEEMGKQDEEKMALDFMDTLGKMEGELQQALRKALTDEELESRARAQINLRCLLMVSEDRCRVLADISKRVQDRTLFVRQKEIAWACLACGFVDRGSHAPATCLCCGAEQATMRAGAWGLA